MTSSTTSFADFSVYTVGDDDVTANGSSFINATLFPEDDDGSVLYRATFDAVDRYLTPVWYILGVPGNVLAFIVWIQKRMRPSSGYFLAALALDECIFLIMQVFFELQTKWGILLLQYEGLCQLFPVLFLTSQHLSPLLVLAFTAERYVSVCHPFARERFWSTRRPMATIALLAVFALTVNAVQAYFWMYDNKKSECSLRDEVTAAGSSSIWSVWSWVTELLVFGVVPSVILLLNVFVILETRRLSAAERQLCSSVRLVNQNNGCQHKQSSTSSPSATTFMLLAVSFYVIATTLPVTICYVLYLSFPEGDPKMSMADRATDPTWNRHIIYTNVRTVIDEIGLSHYALNFYIYLATGRVFRRELGRLFCGKTTTGVSRTDFRSNDSTTAIHAV